MQKFTQIHTLGSRFSLNESDPSRGSLEAILVKGTVAKYVQKLEGRALAACIGESENALGISLRFVTVSVYVIIQRNNHRIRSSCQLHSVLQTEDSDTDRQSGFSAECNYSVESVPIYQITNTVLIVRMQSLSENPGF